MTIWSFWEEISRVMAVLCLITAGAAIVLGGGIAWDALAPALRRALSKKRSLLRSAAVRPNPGHRKERPARPIRKPQSAWHIIS